MMSEMSTLALAMLAGSALGVLFFAGLWWTIEKRMSSEQSALWLLGSLLIRTAIIIAGFLIVWRGHVIRLVACLFGFFIVRVLATRIALRPRSHRHLPGSEAADAP
jgi:F1F0 ATPase subunit 2